MKKRILAIILSVCLILGCIPAYSFIVSGADGTDNSQQIEATGGWTPAQYETDGSLYEDKIAVSKTVSPTDTENYFDIDLQVAVNPEMINQSVDVVVVMDVSNTMNYDHSNSVPADPSESRLQHAKDAINAFVDKYATNENICDQRRFGLVTFNSNTIANLPLTTVNTTAQADSVKSIVNGITAPNDAYRFTNIEAGLQLATNMLNKSDAVYKYMILLTDGYPTTYISSGRTSTTYIEGYNPEMGWENLYDASRAGQDGYFADTVQGKLCCGGTNYSDKGADRADDVAAAAKANGINIFSVGIDVGAQSVSDYINQSGSYYTTVDRSSNTFVIGNDAAGYINWLGNVVGGGENMTGTTYASGNSSEELLDAFDIILEEMEEITVEIATGATYTFDPMSDYVEFLHFFDKAGNAVAEVKNDAGESIAMFGTTDKAIRWLLANAEPDTTDAFGNFIYKLSYRVRLKTELEGFEFEKAFPTNKTTTITFVTKTSVGDSSTSELFTLNFTIPEVEGYGSDLVFIKKDEETGEPLEGVEFTLSHSENCGVCNGDVTIADRTAVSGADGKVVFENVLSGHEFVLTETKYPDGYQTSAPWKVTTSYGKTYLDGKEVSAENPGTITNKIIKPVEAVLKSYVELIGRDRKTEEFDMTVQGNNFSETYANDENGYATYSTFTFDQVGVYEYKGWQIIGEDPTVIYDETEYTVVFTVTLNEDGTKYLLETTINGEAVENDSNPDPLQYVNRIRGNASPVIKATKLLDGAAPADGAFTFELKDTDGNVLQTVTNVGSDVNFAPMSYDNVGTYNYTLSEVKGDDSDLYYDTTVYDVTVTVTKPADNEGDFDAAVTYSVKGEAAEEAVFNNSTIKPVQAVVKSNVELIGRDRKTGEFEMTFNDETFANDKDGNATYETLTFNTPGVYTYNGFQVIGDDDSVIYDETQYEVVFTVTLNEKGDGYDLETTINGEDVENDSNPDPLLYVNRIRGNATPAFKAVKYLDGETPENGAFKFQLKDEDGNVLQTVKNKGSEVKFAKMSFDKVGTYNYTISEVKGTDAIIYDTTVYDVTVTVTKPADNEGDFDATVEYSLDGEAVEEAEFNNKTFEPVKVTFLSNVDIIGRDLKDKEFIMTITGPDFDETYRNDKNGDATYTTISFTEPGVYKYTGVQISTNDPTVIYDETVHTVVCKVTVNKAGTGLKLVTIVDGEVAEDPSNPEPLLYVNRIFESPKTGDNSNMLLWVVLMLLCLGVCASVVFTHKKKNFKH